MSDKITRISDLSLPQLPETIRGYVFHVPQGTTDRVPTDSYIIGDDSGQVRVSYSEYGNFTREMYELEDGYVVELTGIRLPRGVKDVEYPFLAFAGKVTRKNGSA